MDSGSTVKDFGVHVGSAAGCCSSMQEAGIGVGIGVETCANVHAQGEGESISSGGMPAERAAKRRLLFSADGTGELSGAAASQRGVRTGNHFVRLRELIGSSSRGPMILLSRHVHPVMLASGSLTHARVSSFWNQKQVRLPWLVSCIGCRKPFKNAGCFQLYCYGVINAQMCAWAPLLPSLSCSVVQTTSIPRAVLDTQQSRDNIPCVFDKQVRRVIEIPLTLFSRRYRTTRVPAAPAFRAPGKTTTGLPRTPPYSTATFRFLMVRTVTNRGISRARASKVGYRGARVRSPPLCRGTVSHHQNSGLY